MFKAVRIMLEKIWELGQDMIDYEESQGGESNFSYPNGKSVKIDPNTWYLVGLDEQEKNSIVFNKKKGGFQDEETH